MTDYNGLTRNTWTGTWSPTGPHPIGIANELRGGLHAITGLPGEQLTDIPGQRLEEGMLVYVRDTYGAVTGNAFYQYSLLGGESRNPSTGIMPNNAGNWSASGIGGGASALNDLSDVAIDVPPADGDHLIYNGTSGRWENAPSVAGTVPPVGAIQTWGYEHLQPVGAITWTITHSIGSDKVITQIYDDSQKLILPDDIDIYDANTVVITFTTPQTGRALLLLMV